MNDWAVRVESLSKVYRIGGKEKGYKTFRETLSDSIAAPFNKLRSLFSHRNGDNSAEFIYALKDVSFEIKQGETVGIIGRNGAGKSTLLKILSRITEPTGGFAEIHGRVGSLLEVGTGFHPELSGRENIYLNGAILGMKKAEIEKRFDEIVAFAELDKFLDTPVKHYSSGMYVRLAFAVAAHMDSEVLLVDEVLAVGDLAFQKRCLNKMDTVAQEGRTVLFVSHQIDVIRALCKKCILLSSGTIASFDEASITVDEYIHSLSAPELQGTFEVPDQESDPIRILRGRLCDEKNTTKTRFDIYDSIILELQYVVRNPLPGLLVSFEVRKHNSTIFLSFDSDIAEERLESRHPGVYLTRVKIPTPLLKPGSYTISVHTGIANTKSIQRSEDILSFDIEIHSRSSQFLSYSATRPGLIALSLNWETSEMAAEPSRHEDT